MMRLCFPPSALVLAKTPPNKPHKQTTPRASAPALFKSQDGTRGVVQCMLHSLGLQEHKGDTEHVLYNGIR